MESSNLFNHKINLPVLGLGTYHLNEEILKKITLKAYEIGYRHFDTASYYENEKELGEVLKGFPRDEIKVTSKVWHDQMGYYPVLRSFERSLNLLQLDCIDLFLIHWPHPHNLIEESLDALRELKKKKKLKAYGVSNFTIHHLQDALDAGFEIQANQVEYHPYLNQEDLLSFCHLKNIQLIAYCPIARGKVLTDPLLLKIASIHHKNPIQVTLRWLIQKGICPIPKTQNVDRLRQNFDIFDFNLTDEQMVQINQLNKNARLIDQEWSHFDY